MSGIISYGTYLPYFRLQRSQISATLGTPPGKGTRSVASFDEDPTSMGVEAARAALAATPDEVSARALYFATTRPPYLDKANATVIHAALGLDQDVFAADMVGSIRSGVGALCAAMQAAEPTLAVLSDIRTGLPGGADERDGGDGAVALLCAASGDFIAEYLGGASATTEVLDRWRNPGDLAARVWEERFGESVYGPLASAAFADALAKVSITPGDIDHLIVTGSHTRSIRRISKSTGAPSTALVDDLAAVVGNTGTVHPALLLASVLDRAGPGAVLAVVVIADGVDVLVFRTTARLAERRQRVSVNQQLAVTSEDLTVAKFHTWRGVYRLEPPRRPDPQGPSAPPAFRHADWKFGFVGSLCECGTRHLPPSLVCRHCGAVEKMTPERCTEVPGTVTTFSIDHLVYSESPPVVFGVIDFDGGGRYQCELTDMNPAEIAVGTRVEMTFRKLYTVDGIHNYHWKARPTRGEQ